MKRAAGFNDRISTALYLPSVSIQSARWCQTGRPSFSKGHGDNLLRNNAIAVGLYYLVRMKEPGTDTPTPVSLSGLIPSSLHFRVYTVGRLLSSPF